MKSPEKYKKFVKLENNLKEGKNLFKRKERKRQIKKERERKKYTVKAEMKSG